MYFKKSLVFILLVCCLLSGCVNEPQKTASQFEELVEELPTRLIPSDSMNLEFLFEHPEKYGFEDTLLNLPLSSLDDYKKNDQFIEDLIHELETYDIKTFSNEQKETYTLLMEHLKRSRNAAKFYYLDNSYIGSFVGFQAQLPMLLQGFTFERKQDLDNYFHILEQAPKVFLQYGEIEKERQKQNVGMPKAILDKSIEQCISFSNDKNPFLIEDINKKIDAVTFLDTKEKEQAKQKNEEFIRNSLLKAYAQLAQELKQINASEEEVGLAKKENGKEYYEYLIKKDVGVDGSINDIKRYLESKFNDIQTQIFYILQKNPSIQDQIFNGNNNAIVYTKTKTFEETLEYLKLQMEKDFPKVDNLTYDITIVPESMKDNFSPAAYLKGKVDSPMEEPQHIWVNGTFSPSLFETLAHEGYPGHMYQNSYFKQRKLPIVRYLIDYSGYSEGWATYVEWNAWKYAQCDDKEKEVLYVMSLYNQLQNCVIALSDIAIHYEGYTYEEYANFMKGYGLGEDAIGKENLRKQWLIHLETPANYLNYFLTGFKYQDLYDKAKEALQEKMDPIQFHEVMLKAGPVPYSHLETLVNEYINMEKKK